jgi:hypothetical protein
MNSRKLIVLTAARICDMHTCPMQTPGTLDGKDFARIDGIEPGTCKITFPELDKYAWEKI